ncbi:hypothetical protein F511_33673 [Dorcoceras hygrometricum]|uniref:Uncharacterized protein n=1 Tax=Dorcoceras hygrometricum TaxID=472368 RepID=A0A2Z7A5T1_9LAMI|nr:hypothetical protein F511_33673 [Dorcoceras hygrometricum]
MPSSPKPVDVLINQQVNKETPASGMWRHLIGSCVFARFYQQQPTLRQSGPRPDPRLLRHAALEALTRSARTNTPRKTRSEQFPAKLVGGGGGAWGGGGGGVN